ncbi:ATP-binding protein [Streptomyces durhamensis]|uniref:ATP-binding protein n=1 Tax=Streptomyces durhamensis TaxID=68194 RepID=UPI0006896264|nr:ATP-binding protein [Streptomyces durhamensis]
MTDLILAVGAVVAVAAAGTAGHFHRSYRRERGRADQLQGHAEQLTRQLRAAEHAMGQLASEVLPAIAAAGPGGHRGADLPLPPPLMHTPLAGRLRDVAGQAAAAVVRVREDAQAAADHRVAEIRSAADHEIAKARRESREATRAAVRSFASNVVARASRLSREISQGVRSHQDDEAYATLVHIDHTAQQMLLTAQGYAVLAGDKLSRRWPQTSLSDVIRASMGRIEGYQRVEHHELDTVAVQSRAVEAVVHTLAVLLDNALRYSPPTARVHVSVEEGHHACFLTVDDAGLRMDDERLMWASDIMSGKDRDDITQLGAHPQTGLRVASLLAESYGFRVELSAPNIYQGTRAVLVLPKNLLVFSTAGPPATTPAAVAATTPAAVATSSPAAVPAPRNPAAPAAAATTASGLTVRQRPARTHPAPAPAPDTPAVPGRPSVAAAWAAGSRRGRQTDEDTGLTEGH